MFLVVYSVEFKKRDLPHARIVLFLDRDEKIKNPIHIDKFLSVELHDKEQHPTLCISDRFNDSWTLWIT